MADRLFEEEDIIDENEKYFEKLVGENAKYKTPEDLARAKLHSDKFIEQLKAENAEMRTELTTKERLQDVLDKLVQRPVEKQEDNLPPPVKAPDPVNIEELIERKLAERSDSSTKELNRQRVARELEAAWGADWKKVLGSRQRELSLSKEQLQGIAETSPEGFLKIVNTTRPATGTNAPPQSSNNAFRPVGNTRRDQAYYDNIKKTDPKLYWDSKTQTQRFKDAAELGPAFFT